MIHTAPLCCTGPACCVRVMRKVTRRVMRRVMRRGCEERCAVHPSFSCVLRNNSSSPTLLDNLLLLHRPPLSTIPQVSSSSPPVFAPPHFPQHHPLHCPCYSEASHTMSFLSHALYTYHICNTTATGVTSARTTPR